MILIFCRISACLSFDPAAYLSLSFLLIPDFLPSLTTFPTVAIFFSMIYFLIQFLYYSFFPFLSFSIFLLSFSLRLYPHFTPFPSLYLSLINFINFYIRNSFTTSLSLILSCVFSLWISVFILLLYFL